MLRQWSGGCCLLSGLWGKAAGFAQGDPGADPGSGGCFCDEPVPALGLFGIGAAYAHATIQPAQSAQILEDLAKQDKQEAMKRQPLDAFGYVERRAQSCRAWHREKWHVWPSEAR